MSAIGREARYSVSTQKSYTLFAPKILTHYLFQSSHPLASAKAKSRQFFWRLTKKMTQTQELDYFTTYEKLFYLLAYFAQIAFLLITDFHPS